MGWAVEGLGTTRGFFVQKDTLCRHNLPEMIEEAERVILSFRIGPAC
jgi:hypothetical protein